MAGTDLEKYYCLWLWKDAESTKKTIKTDKGQNIDLPKKKKSLSAVATVKT